MKKVADFGRHKNDDSAEHNTPLFKEKYMVHPVQSHTTVWYRCTSNTVCNSPG